MVFEASAVKIKLYWEMLRPSHWVKNFFILVPLLLSSKAFDPDSFGKGAAAFGVFSVIASGVYVINDIADRQRDKEHPLKSKRPIASGRVGVGEAAIIAFLFLAAGLWSAFVLGGEFALTAGVYIILNFAYSWFLKHLVLIDVFAIAANYVLRIVAGTIAINEPITSWVIILATLLALFLALGKRRSEFINLADKGEAHRATLGQYNAYFLDQLIAVVAAATVMAWSLYTTDPAIISRFHTRLMPLTIPLVLYGIFRYMYLLHVEGKGESPTKTFLTDMPLLVTVGLWSVLIIIIRIL